jgi:hypothetical protein
LENASSSSWLSFAGSDADGSCYSDARGPACAKNASRSAVDGAFDLHGHTFVTRILNPADPTFDGAAGWSTDPLVICP